MTDARTREEALMKIPVGQPLTACQFFALLAAAGTLDRPYIPELDDRDDDEANEETDRD